MMLVLGTGFVLTLASGFFPLRKPRFVLKNTLGSFLKSKSAFSAAATAIGATVGTGNIVGVASAISIGGPGAVFWMWIGAFFGMMLKFAEAALAVKYKGGAMVYIEKAFKTRFPAVLWCLCCVFASFGGGNMIQTNAAGTAFKNAFGGSPVIVGFLIAFLCAVVLFCGAKTVIKTSSFLVPFMAVFYVIGCLGILFIFRNNVFPAFLSIFESAFSPLSFGGGIFGIFASKAVGVGISKGTFTHEAGMGSASLAHSESGEKPIIQGCWGIFEVFIDTIFVCSLTALAILSAEKKAFSENSAAEIFGESFGVFGDVFLCISMFLFALAAVIGWAFYAEKCIFYFTGSKFVINLYRTVFCVAAVLGSVTELPIIWSITDIFNGLMIFPNICAIIILFPEIMKIIKKEEHR